ncbi:MAG: hypothetical protein NTY77_13740 [Elusimicrobia bacterium]|nr:hypothetical protein [Elusimicrobiota bacterium]
MTDSASGPESLLVKGIPIREILRQFKTGGGYGVIQRRFPHLAWVDIDEAVHAELYGLVKTRLAQGRTQAEIAKELRCSSSNIWNISRKMERNKFLRREWGGLSSRAVKALVRLRYKSLRDVLVSPPTEERVLGSKGVGWYLYQEIKNAVPLVPSPSVSGPGAAAAAAAPGRSVGGPTPSPREAPAFITKPEHFDGALADPAAPRRTKEMARFFHAIIASAADMPIDDELPSMVPCMAGPSRRWCLGIINVLRKPSEVHWCCPDCGKSGVVVLRNPEMLH